MGPDGEGGGVLGGLFEELLHLLGAAEDLDGAHGEGHDFVGGVLGDKVLHLGDLGVGVLAGVFAGRWKRG